MDTKLLFQDAATFQTPLLAIFAVDVAVGKNADPLPALLTTSDQITNAAANVLTSGEFKAALGETLLLHAPSGLKAERLLIIGLGKVAKLSIHEIRKGAGVAIRFAKPRAIRDVAIAFPEDHALSDEHLDSLPCHLVARALTEGAELAQPDWDIYKSDRKDLSVHSATILAPDGEKTTKSETQNGFTEGLAIAAGQNFARRLVNEPGNVLTPTEFGKRAAAMCAESGLTCEVHSTEKLHELGMGAFWAVSQGSPSPPALIVMTYDPPHRPTRRLPRPWPRWQGHHLRHWRHLHQARRRHGKDEVRHGWSRRHDRCHARHRRPQARRQGHLRHLLGGKHA